MTDGLVRFQASACMATESPVSVPSESALVSPAILVFSYSAATAIPRDPARLSAADEAVLLENASTLIAPELVREAELPELGPMSVSVLASLVTSESAATTATPTMPPIEIAASSDSAKLVLDAEIVSAAECVTLPSSVTPVAPATIEVGIETEMAPSTPPEARALWVLAWLFDVAVSSTNPFVPESDDVEPARISVLAEGWISESVTLPFPAKPRLPERKVISASVKLVDLA